MSSSILSHLALRFSAHPENLATEALAYILAGSETCCSALMALVGQFCSQTGSCELHFETQSAGEDLARPDLIGRDANGDIRLMLEAKFWAGLTDNQPVQYLANLARQGALIFVAPEQRLDLLWPELIHRVRAAGHLESAVETELVRSIRLEDQTLAVISWRVLLGNLLAAAENAREGAAAADLRQLDALCERMDSDAFLPLTSEELNPFVGRRIIQFCDIASTLTDLLVSSGDASVKGLRATGGHGWFGRYLWLRGYGAQLYFGGEAWSDLGESPIWLTIRGADWKPSRAVTAALETAGIKTWFDEEGTHVPIRLATGVELDAVTRDALAQLRRIADALPDLN